MSARLEDTRYARYDGVRRAPWLAVVSLARAKTYAGLAELAATGKRAAKAILGSTYVRDGRTMTMPMPVRITP